MKNRKKNQIIFTSVSAVAFLAIISCTKVELEPEFIKEPSWWDKLVKAVTIEIEVKFGEDTIVYGPDGPVVMPYVDGGLYSITVSRTNQGDVTGDGYNVDGDFVLSLTEGTIDQSLIENDEFVLNESEKLSSCVTNALGLTSGYTIAAGVYPVLRNGSNSVFIAFEE